VRRAVTPRLNPRVRRWLEDLQPEEGCGDGLEAWVDELEAAGRFVCFGKLHVDRAVLEQRFACVSQRCAPGRPRGRWLSCCADLDLVLSPLELSQLEAHREPLLRWLAEHEPRFAKSRPPAFWLDHSALVRRPKGRCVFSTLDEAGRIRCHLHAYAKAEGVPLDAVQPFTCRVFPLLLFVLGRGQLALSVLSERTCSLVGCYPPRYFPCLSDARGPPLVQGMAHELDWMFGKGFARLLSRQ